MGVDLINILVWIIMGGIAGVVASYLVGDKSISVMDIVWGVIGAMIGGIIFQFFGGSGITGLNFYSIIVAIVGSVIVLSIIKSVNSRSRDIYSG